ncbi:MAG: hypothetical protein ACR9NN_09005 [Nostochopsis sp.]
MKNKILALAAVGTAVVGGSLFSAPAQAQLTTSQAVTVNVNVPEILYLRTFDNVNLAVTEAELAGGTAVTAGGVNILPDYDGITDGTTIINQTSPFTGATAGITKNVDDLYAVWSNNPNGVTIDLDASVTLSGVNNGDAITATLNKTDADPTTLVGLDTPFVGGVDIDLPDISNTSADDYTGTITVTASTL